MARCRCIAACRSAAFATRRSRCRLNEINVGRVQTAIDAGLIDAKAPVDAAAMVKAGLMRREKGGVKLLGEGELKSKIEFSVWRASKSAIAAVEKAGGTVKILAPAKEEDEVPKGKNKRKALDAAKGGDKPKGGKPKAEARRRTEERRIVGPWRCPCLRVRPKMPRATVLDHRPYLEGCEEGVPRSQGA